MMRLMDEEFDDGMAEMTHDGADSATTTVNLRSLYACFKKASTVFE